MRHHHVAAFAVFTLLVGGCAHDTGKPRESVNSLGMRLVRIEPGSFDMGVDSVPLPTELTKGISGASWDRPDGNGDYDGEPSWSPTTSQMAFVSDRSGAGYIWLLNDVSTPAATATWGRVKAQYRN